MDTQRLEQLKTLSEIATPGPWAAEGWLIVRDVKTKRNRVAIGGASGNMSSGVKSANAIIMAAAHELLTEVRRLTVQIEECRAAEIQIMETNRNLTAALADAQKERKNV